MPRYGSPSCANCSSRNARELRSQRRASRVLATAPAANHSRYAAASDPITISMRQSRGFGACSGCCFAVASAICCRRCSSLSGMRCGPWCFCCFRTSSVPSNSSSSSACTTRARRRVAGFFALFAAASAASAAAAAAACASLSSSSSSASVSVSVSVARTPVSASSSSSSAASSCIRNATRFPLPACCPAGSAAAAHIASTANSSATSASSRTVRRCAISNEENKQTIKKKGVFSPHKKKKDNSQKEKRATSQGRER